MNTETKTRPAAATDTAKVKPTTKIATVTALLSREQVPTLDELMQATGLQQHSVLAALTDIEKTSPDTVKDSRENETRAVSLGYDVARFKLLAFVLSAALAGMAGATKTLVFQLASLTDVHWHMSGEVVLMTLLGGLGTVLGPLVGAATIVSLQTELADSVGSWVTVIMGVIFVVCVLLFRRGIVGELQALIQRAGIR